MKGLPKFIYVKVEGAKDEEWLNAEEKADNLGFEVGEQALVGRYMLVSVDEVKAVLQKKVRKG